MSSPQKPNRPTAPSGHLANSHLVQRIEGRWILQILLCLNKGEHRFSDLREAIPPISASVLTERIRGLERSGLIERRYLPPPFASQVYGLTVAAAGLKPALDALANWRAETPGIASRHMTL